MRTLMHSPREVLRPTGCPKLSARELPLQWMRRGGWGSPSDTSRSPPTSVSRRRTVTPSLLSAAGAATSGVPGEEKELLWCRARCTWGGTPSPELVLGGNAPFADVHPHDTRPLPLASVLDPPPRGGRGVRGLSPPLRRNLELRGLTARAIAASSRTTRYGATAVERTLIPSPWGSPARALGDPRALGRSST